MRKVQILLIGCLLASISLSGQTTNQMVIQTKKLGAPIQHTMYGLFFEDINYAADGGLYAEMIKNRSFEFPQHLMGWQSFGNVALKDDGPFARNPHYVRLSDPGHEHKRTGLVNEGYFGVAFKQNAEYRFSVWARVPEGASAIRVELIDPSSMTETQVLAFKKLTIDAKAWKKYEVVLQSPVTHAKGQLRIFLDSPNPVDLEHISLFPVDTWKGHQNGLRKDLAQALYDIRPGVFRFPGGCIVEGADLATRYNWKNSVGPVENRPLNENRWEYTFPHRFFPDYFQSYGLGFYEFFQLSEEIGAEPLPVLSVGLACQFQNNDPAAHMAVGSDEFNACVQDALDLIEFANGEVTTTWGKLRADMGHPAPFNLKFIAIGNEQWGPEYPEHLLPFIKAIRAKYPKMNIIGSSGPNSEGDQFDYLWPEMKKLGADLVDEHFYRPEQWFLSQGARYDNYDRKGPKVFAGEYACHGRGKKWNHFHASLLEAAFMTGLERNADIVHMATYAPLFAHVEGWQWRPDMIWFDNLNSVRTASYLVQQLYSTHKGTNALTMKMNGRNVTGADGQNGLFASAVWDELSKSYIVKVINTGTKAQPITLTFDGLKKNSVLKGTKVITLSAADPDSDNTLEHPHLIAPKEAALSFEGTTFSTEIAPATFAIYQFSK